MHSPLDLTTSWPLFLRMRTRAFREVRGAHPISRRLLPVASATLAHGPAANQNLSPVERAKILAATFGKAQRPGTLTALERARALAASIGGSQATTAASHFMDELDSNDFPPEARVRATNRENILRVAEETGAAIIARGVYCPPGKTPTTGEKRLCLAIEGPSELAVKAAKTEMLRTLNEETRTVAIKGRATYGKYSLISHPPPL